VFDEGERNRGQEHGRDDERSGLEVLDQTGTRVLRDQTPVGEEEDAVEPQSRALARPWSERTTGEAVAYDPAVEDLRVETEGIMLAGSYSPAGGTVVVALHGAGEGTREMFLYEHLHEALPPAGIGVVTFDRRGEGESTGDASRGRFDVQARDALAVLEAVDAERAGLWGVSQGGWIGPIAAAQSDRVAFLVLIASTGVTPSEQMMYAVAEQIHRDGYGESAVEQALDLRRRFEDCVHGREVDEEKLKADLVAVLDEPWASHLFLPPMLLDDEGRRLWIDEMDFDPRPVFARTRVPALLFYGADDGWTPVGPSVEAWRAARGDEVEIVVIPGASHELTLPDGTIAPVYERTVIDWLSRLEED